MSSGTDKIVSSIMSEAQEKADVIIQDANAEVSAIQAKAEKTAEAEKTKILENGKKQSDMRYQQIISEAKMNARRAELGAKEEVIEAAFDKATEELKVKYESSKEDYMDAREEYIEELESLSNNIGSGSSPEVEYGGINTGVSGPVIEGVDYIAQAASDTIQTQINNTEVVENVSTNITDAMSKSATTINNNFNNSTKINTLALSSKNLVLI